MNFLSYASRPDPELDLLEGAVLIAQIGYPALELRAESIRFDQLAAPLAGLGLAQETASRQAQALSDYLYRVCGFRGNAESYFDPENSFINSVLDRKLGIPISLAVVYLQVAKRLGLQASGVGFPGHFLVRVDDERETVVVDPFFGGETLDQAALQGLLKRAAPRMLFRAEMLEAVGVRQIMIRMLINLKSIYAARGDGGHLLVVLDRLVDLMPEASDEIRDRGFLLAKMGASRGALADFRRYVDALPHAGDAEDIRRAIRQLESQSSLLA